MVNSSCNLITSRTGLLDQLRSVVGTVVDENQHLRAQKMVLQKSTLHSQDSVISLQNGLIICKNEQLGSDEKILKTKMKSYSEAVRSNHGSQNTDLKVVQ